MDASINMNSLEVKKYPRALRKLAYPVLAGYLAAVILVGALFAVPGFHPWLSAHLTWIVVLCQLPGAATADLSPNIRLLLIEPDLDRVSLVWVGECALELPFTREQLTNVRHGVVWP